MHINGFGVSDKIDSPDSFQQLVSAPDPLRISDEELEDFVLLRRKREVFAVAGDTALACKEAEIATLDDLAILR